MSSGNPPDAVELLKSTSLFASLPTDGLEHIAAVAVLRRNLLIYGLGGLIIPFIGIKAIDLVITTLNLA